ncbi:MAG: hypothetical protein P4L91_01100 [Burkholderiaceae bacterium]|nr:hypothetical protein [Burkholderiaceae bacterium]
MKNEKTYWFPSKRYGWGWGMPTVWQGWVVVVVFGLSILAGAVMLLPSGGSGVFVAYCALATVILVAICWLKGEPPEWRWGDK